jgi:hypothetical protein
MLLLLLLTGFVILVILYTLIIQTMKDSISQWVLRKLDKNENENDN